MNNDTRFDNLVSDVVAMRRHAWEEHNIRDMPLQITFCTHDGDHYPIPDVYAAQVGPNLRLGQLIAALFETGRAAAPEVIGNLESVLIVNEGYAKIIPAEGRDQASKAMESYVQGDFQREYENSPATDVKEVLCVTAAVDDLVGGCEIRQAFIPFSIDDGGVLIMAEPQVHGDDAVMGDVVDQLRFWFRKEKLS